MKRAPRRPMHGRLDGSVEAKKLTALVLESLAGVRTPTDAAQQAGVSVQRFYLLEMRALQGIVRSLEPRKKGRQLSDSRLLAVALKEKERLARDLARTQALLRSAHRVIGVPTVTSNDRPGKIDGKGKRKKRPTTRAVKAVALLRASEERAPDAETMSTS